MKQPTEAKYNAARAKCVSAWNKMMDLRFAIERRYGSFQLAWCKASERNAYGRAHKAYDRACTAFHALLESAPRDWRPSHEALSVEPPRAWGY